MAQPVAPETRAAIIAALTAGGTRNAVARQFDVSGALVTSIAKSIGHQFDRSHTALAVAARQIDMKAEQADLARMFMIRAREALEDMDAPTITGHWSSATDTRGATYDEHLLPAPDIADRRQLITIAGIGVQRAAELIRASDGGDVVEGVAVITGLAAALTNAVHLLDGVDPTIVEAPEIPDDD